MKIVFFCPPSSVINGGIKHIFRMAEALIAEGREAVIFEQNGTRPSWFQSTAPIVGQGVFTKEADHIYVLPEDQMRILSDFSAFPQRKIIYSQNHFYSGLGIGKAESYAAYGITDIICSGRTIYEHSRLRHPTLNSYIVPCAVDQNQFKPAQEKESVIAFMPRKRAIEASYIQDMFCFTYPQYRDWQWQEIANVSESEVARLMGQAKVFLSLSRLEGFGLTPLEAMASSCVVAGFTGIGGREYASDENGFWAGEDDFPSCIAALAKAVQLTIASPSALQSYYINCHKTLSSYTPEIFRKSVKEVWDKILKV